MKAMGLLGTRTKKRWQTTHLDPGGSSIDDHVKRRFAPDELNRIWVADATYLHTSQGVLYLAIVMDSASRRIIGWSMASRQDTNLMHDALKAAIARRSYRTCTDIHHANRGSQ